MTFFGFRSASDHPFDTAFDTPIYPYFRKSVVYAQKLAPKSATYSLKLAPKSV